MPVPWGVVGLVARMEGRKGGKWEEEEGGRSKTWIGEVEEMGGDPSSRKGRRERGRHFGGGGGGGLAWKKRAESYLFSKRRRGLFRSFPYLSENEELLLLHSASFLSFPFFSRVLGKTRKNFLENGKGRAVCRPAGWLVSLAPLVLFSSFFRTFSFFHLNA